VPEHPDEFDLALRRWSAQEKIMSHAGIASLLDLDPPLVDQMQIAAGADNATSSAAMLGATSDLLEAAAEEIAVRSA
jgi:hypothetical protein